MAMPVLKPTKQRCNNKRFFGLDIETVGAKNTFYMGSIYDYQTDSHTIFYDKDKLKDHLKDNKKFKNSYICASNLMFDFYGIFNQDDPDLQNFDTIIGSGQLITASAYLKRNNGGFLHPSVYSEYRKTNTNTLHKINFIDTRNYAGLSVADIGAILKLPKLDKPACLGRLPNDEQEKHELEAYNKRDSEISAKFMAFLFQGFEDLGATPKITIAATAMSLFKNKYLDRKIFQPAVDILDKQFNAFYGGRTEAFKRGYTNAKLYLYDVNSLYPYSMKNVFPDPNSLRITYKNTQQYILDYHGISRVKIQTPLNIDYPFLPVRTKDKLIFPLGTFEGWYTHIELRKALELGYKIVKVMETHYYKKTMRPFDGYVDDLYNKRQQYKGSPMQLVVKLLLNALFGKFGQSYRGITNLKPFNLTIDDINKLDKFERIGQFIATKEDKRPSAFCIPVWAAYITGYARIHMHPLLVKYSALYSDTDSLITEHKIEQGSRLGELKLENTLKTAYIIKPKMYMFMNEDDECIVKIKGVGTKIDYNLFLEIMDTRKVSYTKFVKIREAIRRSLACNEMIDVQKTLNLDDNKRLWEYAHFDPKTIQSSSPLLISDYENMPNKNCLEKHKCLNTTIPIH